MSKQLNTRIKYKCDIKDAWDSCDKVGLPGELYVVKTTNGTALRVCCKEGQKIKETPYVAVDPFLIELTTPSLSVSEMEYNGSCQKPTLANYDESKMILFQDVSAQDVGEYRIGILPKTGYCWPGNDCTPKYYTWKITKKKYTPILTLANATVNGSTTDKTVTENDVVIFDGNKKNLGLSIESAPGVTPIVQFDDSDSYLNYDLSLEVDNFTYSVLFSPQSLLSIFTKDIKITFPTSLNYESTVDSITFKLFYKGTVNSVLDNNTWETISKVSELGVAKYCWSVGDTKKIILNGKVGDNLQLSRYTTNVFIIGFDHTNGTLGKGLDNRPIDTNVNIVTQKFNVLAKTDRGIHFGCFKDIDTGKEIALIDWMYGKHGAEGSGAAATTYNGSTYLAYRGKGGLKSSTYMNVRNQKYFSMGHGQSKATTYYVNNSNQFPNAPTGETFLYECSSQGWRGTEVRYDILGSVDQWLGGDNNSSYSNGTYLCNNIVHYATTNCAKSPVDNTLMAAFPEDLRSVMKPMLKYTTPFNVEDYTIDYLPLMSALEYTGINSWDDNNPNVVLFPYNYYYAIYYLEHYDTYGIDWEVYHAYNCTLETTDYHTQYEYYTLSTRTDKHKYAQLTISNTTEALQTFVPCWTRTSRKSGAGAGAWNPTPNAYFICSYPNNDSLFVYDVATKSQGISPVFKV